MNTEQIIFNIMKSNAHSWVRYWLTKEISGLTMPGEYIELRSNFLSDGMLKELIDAGFNIQRITPQMINSDAYCEVLLKRELSACA